MLNRNKKMLVSRYLVLGTQFGILSFVGVLGCGPGGFPSLSANGAFGEGTESGAPVPAPAPVPPEPGEPETEPGESETEPRGGADFGSPTDGCIDESLAGWSMPILLNDNTDEAHDDYLSSCGGDGRLDRAYDFVAPRDGEFIFSIATSWDLDFRPTIALYEVPCGDYEVDCSFSDVIAYLSKGEAVVVVVDGGEYDSYVSGDYWLSIEVDDDMACVDSELGSLQVPWSLTFSLNGAGDDFMTSCSSDDGAYGVDRIFQWSAQSPGFYRFKAVGDEPGVVVAVVLGCVEEEPMCDGSSTLSSAIVDVYLQANETVEIVVESWESADVTLSVSPVPSVPPLL